MCSVSDDTQDVYHKWTRTNSTNNNNSGVREKESEKREANTQNILQMSKTFLVEIFFLAKKEKWNPKCRKKTNSTTKIIQSIKKTTTKSKAHILKQNCGKIAVKFE